MLRAAGWRQCKTAREGLTVMEKFNKATAGLISQVNTLTSASDWIPCAQCQTPYRPAGIDKNGMCWSCRDRKRELEQTLNRALSPKALALHTWDRFTVTSDNQSAVDAVVEFDPAKESLYLFGDC